MPAEWTPLPPLEALAFFARKTGYTPAWSWQEIYGDEHKAAFTVAKMMQLDLLKQVREEVDRAIAGKVTLQDFQKNLMPILKGAGWWGTQETDGGTVQLGSPERLKVIFDTNVRQAYHAGAWERAQRTKQDLPYLIYELGPSREHRPEHVHWAGTVLPIDDPWWQSHHPTNGWGCKCSTRQLTAEQAQQEGYTPGRRPAFEGEKVPWTNKATGVTRQVPRGIDPGFENNPGERMGTLEALQTQKFNQAPPDLSRAAISDLVLGPSFANWFQAPNGSFPVMRLSDAQAEIIGAQASIRVAVFSQDSIVKNQNHHPDLTIDDYRLIPGMGDNPVIQTTDGDDLVLVSRAGDKDRPYYIVIKATRTGRGIFVKSFRRMKDEDIAIPK